MKYDVCTSFGNGNMEALSIIKEIAALEVPNDEEIIFDFRQYNENNPFSNLVIANAVRDCASHIEQRKRLLPHASNYLAHLGFYHMIGANYGKELGEATPNSNYVPITHIHFEGDFYRNIEKTSKDLAKLLFFDKGLETFLSYIFVETIRNVYEHSEDDSVYVAAQKWPRFGLLEIAIADSGCGIAHSLKRRFSKYDDKNLLYLSCQPGVSACSNFSYLDKEDGWRNSGYGLYLLRKLAIAYGGSFLICSGKNALWQTQSGVREIDTDYTGTAIAIRIKTNTGIDFEATRNRILKEGELKAKEIQGAIHKASRSSGGHYR